MEPTTPLDWLYSTQWFGVKLGLGNMERLLREALANPAPGVKVLHVAGTNGKGSVCAIADSVARALGIKTGLFTSPHLVDFRERIRVNGEMIPADDLDRELDQLRELVSSWDPHPTFFELSLAVALRWFKARGCELLVLETGMGGRLDATNAVPSDVSVITPIGMDHCEWLGDTLEKIAAEKAGIFKPGVPVFSSAQEPGAKRVLLEHANMVRCPIRFIEEPLAGYPLSLPGTFQRHNAALATEALFSLGYPLNVESVSYGLSHVSWPGRFDRRPEHRMVLDGAHNPHGAAMLARVWREWFPRDNATLVFSALSDKDPVALLRELRPIADHIIVCPVQSPRAQPTASLAAAAREAGFAEEDLSTAPDLPGALASARAMENTILVAGSLYLIGQTLAEIDKYPYRPTAQ